MLELQDGTTKSWQASLTHTGVHKTLTKWLIHSWSTLCARKSHGQHGHTRLTTARTWGSHHLPPYSILCAFPWGQHPNGFSLPGLPRDSRVRVPKSRQLGLPGLWGRITSCTELRSRCGLKQSYSSRPELSNGKWHIVCSQVFRVDSRLLVVGSQNWQTLGSLTPRPSFGHNLCLRCPNEQCEPILDIYTSRAFHWYKERHKPLRFDPSNRSLKFWESLWDFNSTQLPTWEFTWECECSLSHTFCTPGNMWCDSLVYY